MNIFWKIILALAALIAFWFVGKSSYGFYHYYRLNAEAPATIEKWDLVQLSSSKFGYEVSYYFKASGKRFDKKELLRSFHYPNKYAAQGDLKHLIEQSWRAYYAQGRPQISALENPFPLKSSLYALLSLGVFFYFFWLYLRYRGAPTSLD